VSGRSGLVIRRSEEKNVTTRGAIAATWVVKQIKQTVLFAVVAIIWDDGLDSNRGEPQKCAAWPVLASKISNIDASHNHCFQQICAEVFVIIGDCSVNSSWDAAQSHYLSIYTLIHSLSLGF
jgi:hypothetical protein